MSDEENESGESRELAVLDTSHIARTVAARLSLPIHRKGDDEDEAVIIVVHTAKDLEIIDWARGIRNVVGIVAWELPERDLSKLLEVDLPVLIGHVGPDQLKSLVQWGGQTVANEVERDRADRLAHIEEMFHDEPVSVQEPESA